MKVAEILKRENNNMDLVRIIVASMVIWSHSFPAGTDPIAKFVKIIGVGNLAVNIFFFISGLLVTNSILKKKSGSKYLIARCFRLFPALILLLIVTTFIMGPILSNIPIKDYFSNIETWYYLFSNLILAPLYHLPGVQNISGVPFELNGTLWTLPFEFGCYLFLLGAFYLIKDKKNVASVFIVCLVLFMMLPSDILISVSGIPYFSECRYSIACFAIGSFFAIHQDEINLDSKLILGIALIGMSFWRWNNIVIILFSILLSIFFLYLSIDKVFLKLRPKHDISYGLYIWHPMVQLCIARYIPVVENPYLFFLSSVILSSFVAYCSSVLVEERAINFGQKFGVQFYNFSHNKNKFEKLGFVVLAILIMIVYAKLH